MIKIPAPKIALINRVGDAIALHIVTVFIPQVLSGQAVFNPVGNDVNIHGFAKMNNGLSNSLGILVIV